MQGRRDRRVVLRRVRERLHHQLVSECEGRTLVDGRQQTRVVGREHHDQHVAEVFSRGAHHAGAADVDLLDEIREAGAGLARRFCKRIEIDDDDVDRLDAEPRDGLHVVRMVAAPQGCRRGPSGAASSRGRPSFPESRWSSDTPVTGRPASASARAVPPVETSSNPARREAASEFDNTGLICNADQGSCINRKVQYHLCGRRAGLAPKGKAA